MNTPSVTFWRGGMSPYNCLGAKIVIQHDIIIQDAGRQKPKGFFFITVEPVLSGHPRGVVIA